MFFHETVLATIVSIIIIKKLFQTIWKLQLEEILVCNCPVQMGRPFYEVE